MSQIELFSICDKVVIEECCLDEPATYVFDIETGSCGLQGSDSYAITINNDRLIIPIECSSYILGYFEQLAAMISLDTVIEKYGLGKYTTKKVFLAVKSKTTRRMFSRNKEKLDIEIIFDDLADFATLMFYYHENIYDNSENYYIVE